MKILTQIRSKSALKAFTMTEVVIATVIFALAMTGVFASMSQLRQPAVESSQEVTAAFIGKRFLDDLRQEVRQDTWNNNNLALGLHTVPSYVTVDGKAYNLTYTVSNDPTTEARFVTLNVSW